MNQIVFTVSTEVENTGSNIEVYATLDGAMARGLDLLRTYHHDSNSKEDLRNWLKNFEMQQWATVDFDRYYIVICDHEVFP